MLGLNWIYHETVHPEEHASLEYDSGPTTSMQEEAQSKGAVGKMLYTKLLRTQGASQQKLDIIKKAAVRAGFVPKQKIYSYAKAISIADLSNEHVLWVAPWDEEWIVCIPGPRFYRIGDSDGIESFLLEYLKLKGSCTSIPPVPDRLRTSYRVTEFSQWLGIVFARLRDEYRQMGWHELTDGEAVEAWERWSEVSNRLESNSSEPQPSQSWNIRHIATSRDFSEEQQELVCDLERKLLSAMGQIGDGVWLALEFNHPCYRFVARDVPDILHPWPIELIPTSDPAAFVASDFSCGIATQLARSITVFGQPLLTIVTQDMPELLTNSPPCKW